MIYKFVAGVSGLYRIDDRYKHLGKVVYGIVHGLGEFTYRGVCKLDSKFPGNRFVKKIKAMLVSLVAKLASFEKSNKIL
jgi:hypothetical protein